MQARQHVRYTLTGFLFLQMAAIMAASEAGRQLNQVNEFRAGGLVRKLNHLGVLHLTKRYQCLTNFVRPVLGCIDADFCK